MLLEYACTYLLDLERISIALWRLDGLHDRDTVDRLRLQVDLETEDDIAAVVVDVEDDVFGIRCAGVGLDEGFPVEGFAFEWEWGVAAYIYHRVSTYVHCRSPGQSALLLPRKIWDSYLHQ